MLFNFEYIHWTQEEVPYIDATTGETQIDLIWIDNVVSRGQFLQLLREGKRSCLELRYVYGGIRRPDLLASPYEWDGKKLIAIASASQTEILELPF